MVDVQGASSMSRIVQLNKYNKIRIKLMKEALTEKMIHHQSLTEEDFQESVEFQVFKDEHFTKHKKYSPHCTPTRQKSINSISVYRISPSNTENSNHLSPIEVQYINEPSTGVSKPHTDKAKLNFLRNDSKMRQSNDQKKRRQIRLQRYSRNDNSEAKKSARQTSVDDQQQKHNKEKISLLKRIIEHYNVKSIERNYYSNLINNLGIKINTNLSSKNEFVTVKKIIPKTSMRRQLTKAKNENTFKLRENLNVNGYDLYDDYFKHSHITIQAHSINELIACNSDQKVLHQQSAKHHSMNKLEKYKCKDRKSRISGHSNYKNALSKYETMQESKARFIENMSDNCINVKVNKFRQFLFMVNFSCGVYRQFDIPKYDTPFKIFIGKGNNNNLIKAVMKKRFWFQIVKSKEEANFIWTQLKEEEVYNKQNSKSNDISCRNKQENVCQFVSEHIKDCAIEQLKQEEKTNHTFRNGVCTEVSASPANNSLEKTHVFQPSSKKQYKNTAKSIAKTSQIIQPQMKIFTKKQMQAYCQLMNQFSYKKRNKFNDRLKYLKKFKSVMLMELNQELIHNHLPVNGLLGNKKAMFYMLKQYYSLNRKNVFDIVPLTFHIRKGFLDEQFKFFMNKYMSNKSSKLPNYWIVKPGQFSNRGQGITCTSKIDDIRSRIHNLRKLGKNKSLILQQYIVNPLLYNNRKFDIRTYMLLTVNNGKLRGYWYQDGYIRTSSYIWTLEEITDSYIHLTNDAIQKHSSNYGKYEPGNKLNYSQLQRYLDSLPRNGKNYNFQTQIYPKLKQIATDAIRSSFCFIDPSRKGNNFEIFGFDFMIDSHFKPWLIEINTNPCLEINCPVLERIIPSMVQNAFRIAVDPIFPPPLNFSSTYKYSIPENALHYNKFELIFDEERDGSALRELYRNNQIIESMDDYQEDKEVYQQQGPEINLEQS